MDPLTDLGIAVAAEATTSLLAKIKKHIGYLYKYNENLNNLEVAAEKLDDKRTDASRFARDAHKNLKDVSSTVVHWQSEADELHPKAQKIITANHISCLNLWSRYSSSKHAWELAQEIDEKVQSAPDFGTAFDRPAPELGAKFNLRGFIEFDSRVTILNGVLEALKDEEVNMCSICGMGGVGKTTLTKKLIQRVESDHLFDKVVMVTVSQKPNFDKIQKEIIELLDVKIEEDTMPARANKLNAWITSNKTLLILDDVWWQLNDEDFEDIGIPLASIACKILVTSRNEDECKKMGSQRNFLIDVLEDGEAWALFSRNAGKCVEDLNIQETARKIADECDGLPVVIVTVAKTLKDKPAGVWNDSLLKFQNSNIQGILGMEKVYSRIQLSYDLLNNQEAQSCFRLCCLFPEDHDISVEFLVWFGKGLKLFKNVQCISQARDRVELLVDKLKSCFLLLDGKGDGYNHVKMHDTLRDFAISISSKDTHPYIVGSEMVMHHWPHVNNDQYENCSAISFICDRIMEHPVDLRCPKLELLQIISEAGDSGQLPIGFFEGLLELKVLHLDVPPLLESLTMLRKLITLVIIEDTRSWPDEKEPRKIGDLIGRGDLKNLEIFAFASTRKPCDDFPEEIGLLCNMRILKFQTGFRYMAPGVLSKLVKLEMLEVPVEFMSWGCKEEGGERVNASLDEIESLPLITLSIGVPKGSILSENLVKNIATYNVFTGSYFEDMKFEKLVSNTSLQVVDADVTVNWIRGLGAKCESLGLKRVRNLKNIIMFMPLKKIYLEECSEMEYLVDDTLSFTILSQLQNLLLLKMKSLIELWRFSKIESSPSFTDLLCVYIKDCPKLKHPFSLSMAKEMRQLESMTIWGCEAVEEIFCRHDENEIMEENAAKIDVKEVDHVIIIFAKLKSLRLMCLPKLRILYDGNHGIEAPLLEEFRIYQCHDMKALSYGSFIAPRLNNVEIDINCYPVSEDVSAIVNKVNKLNREKPGTESDFEEDVMENKDAEIHHISN